MSQKLVFTNNINDALAIEIASLRPDRVFVLCDTNTYELVLPQLGMSEDVATVTIAAGDEAKTLDSATTVWRELTQKGATRHSLLINAGGGVVTDLGGFVAATFKRGMKFINVPTTLLGAVDAAVGGKTGVNFMGLKNEIGVFAPADSVVISSRFFSTLPRRELLSGYAEMLKHGLLSSSAAIDALMSRDPDEIDDDTMLALLRDSVAVKAGVVSRDPTEKGERKVLNLGHTIGHAIESLAMRRGQPVAHGYAVAWGLVAELVLSHLQLGLDSTFLHKFSNYVADNYGAPSLTCDDYPELIELMGHDKKNSVAGALNFTLVRAPGDVKYDCVVDDLEIVGAALDITRDLLHC